MAGKTIDAALSAKIIDGKLDLVYAYHDANGYIYCTFKRKDDCWIDTLARLKPRDNTEVRP